MDRLIIERSKIDDDLFTAIYTVKVTDRYNKKKPTIKVGLFVDYCLASILSPTKSK